MKFTYVPLPITKQSKGGDGNDNGQYLLQMPMTYGTVIGYSPPLSALMAEQAVNDDDDGVVGVVDNGVGEFPIERHKDNMALYRILWDGHGIPSGDWVH